MSRDVEKADVAKMRCADHPSAARQVVADAQTGDVTMSCLVCLKRVGAFNLRDVTPPPERLQ